MRFMKNRHRGLPARAPSGRSEPLTGPFGDADEGEWEFILTDDNVLHRIPVLAPSGAAISGVEGPGGLQWKRIRERGFDGLAAPYRGYTFQIWCLHRTEPDTSQSRCALVLQRLRGAWEALAVGTPDALKEIAGKRVKEMEAQIERENRALVEAMIRDRRERR